MTDHDEMTEGAVAASGTSAPAASEVALEPEDYYYEGPYMVFTAAYHARRGYCCNSDCRHCPYR